MPNGSVTGPPASHQTVKLARGRHSSPEDGVCVMELASMLAGEPLSDHPQSVCPVIGAFLRAYNDRLDDCRRQDLYAYAAQVVGTRSTAAVERRRAELCRQWAGRARHRGSSSGEPPGPPRRLDAWLWTRRGENAGRRAALTVGRREPDHGGHTPDYELHRAALRFLDELIAVEADDAPRLADLDALALQGQSRRLDSPAAIPDRRGGPSA